MLCCECKNRKMNIIGNNCSFCNHVYCKSCKGLEKILYFIQKYKLKRRNIELKDYIQYSNISETDIEYFEEVDFNENENNNNKQNTIFKKNKCFSFCNIL